MAENPSLSSEWKTERVRYDESGDSEDGEDDELPCVIGECQWDYLTRLAEISEQFVPQGAAYLKERFVIFKEERVGGRARVTIDEERVLWQGWTEIKSWRYWGWFVVRMLEKGVLIRSFILSQCRDLRTGVISRSAFATTPQKQSVVTLSLINKKTFIFIYC